MVNQNGLKIYSSSVWVRPFSESEENAGLEIYAQGQLNEDKYEIILIEELQANKYYEIKIKFSRRFSLNTTPSESGFVLINE